MKTKLLAAMCCIGSLSLNAQCDGVISLTYYNITPLPFTNVSGTSGFNFTFGVNCYETIVYRTSTGFPPAAYMTIQLDLKNCSTGTVIQTQDYPITVYSTPVGVSDPCYNSCGCVFRWDASPPVLPTAGFYIPNQPCGSYCIEAKVKSISYNASTDMAYLYGKQMAAVNIGGGTTVCSLAPTTGTLSLGIVHIVNFSGSSGISALLTNTNPTCGMSNGSISVTPSGGSSPYTYTWYGTSATGATASSLAAGSYTVTVASSDGCAITYSTTLTGSISATISPGSQSTCKDKCYNFTSTASPAGTYTFTLQRSVTSSSTPGGFTDIGSGSAVCTRVQTLPTPPNITYNHYRFKVTSSSGCVGYSPVTTITVNEDCVTNYTNGCCGSGGGGGGGSSSGEVTPDQGSEEVILAVLPNPAITEAKIRFNVPAGNGRIEIYAMNGQLVQRMDGLAGSGEMILQLDEYAAGTYTVILYNGDTQTLNEKLIIQK